jgi:phosphate transport system substrate-binding protein
MRWPLSIVLFGMTLAGLSRLAAAPTTATEPAPVTILAGTLDSIGSDSLNNLMTYWAEAFRARHPNVIIQIEGKGSSTAPTALIEGTAQIGPMSRPMKDTEINAFRARFGYPPHAVSVALDTLAIYVHRDNPLQVISLEQLDGIFSRTGFSSSPPIDRWRDLSLTTPWAERRITLHGRNSASGTYGFFKTLVLRGGDFRPSMNEQPGSAAVVQAVASDILGIGFSGIGYRNAGVKVLAVSANGSQPALPTLRECLSGEYPIARLLFIYVNKDPVDGIDPITREFLHFVLSDEGQRIVEADGFYPLPADIVTRNLDSLNP